MPIPSPSSVLLRTQSDERLVVLARAGHERAFEAIVERYRGPLLRAARRYLPEARAEDALQQAYISAWSALQRGDEVRDLRAWLYRIVHNTALNQLRVSGYDYAELEDSLRASDAPQEEMERRAIVRQTLTGLAALPERQREALLRVAVEGRSQEEVARELGVTEGAVRQLVHRARLTLRAAATAITPLPVATWAAGAAGARGRELADEPSGSPSSSAARARVPSWPRRVRWPCWRRAPRSRCRRSSPSGAEPPPRPRVARTATPTPPTVDRTPAATPRATVVATQTPARARTRRQEDVQRSREKPRAERRPLRVTDSPGLRTRDRARTPVPTLGLRVRILGLFELRVRLGVLRFGPLRLVRLRFSGSVRRGRVRRAPARRGPIRSGSGSSGSGSSGSGSSDSGSGADNSGPGSVNSARGRARAMTRPVRPGSGSGDDTSGSLESSGSGPDSSGLGSGGSGSGTSGSGSSGSGSSGSGHGSGHGGDDSAPTPPRRPPRSPFVLALQIGPCRSR